jgi:hypothetical protein
MDALTSINLAPVLKNLLIQKNNSLIIILCQVKRDIFSFNGVVFGDSLGDGPETAIARVVDLLGENDAFDGFLGLCNGNPRLPHKECQELLETWRLFESRDATN